MKFTKANFDLMTVAGSLLGGVVAKFVEKFTTKEDQDNNYLTIGVQAVAGAAISALVKNNAVKAAGASMIGVAGYNLAKELSIGEAETKDETPKESGIGSIGLLPSQLAISGQKVAGVKGTKEKEKESVKKNVF